MEKDCLKILIFGSITSQSATESFANALLPFSNVRQVNWRYKPIPQIWYYSFLRILYRVLECIYWSLRLFKEVHSFQANIIIAQQAYLNGLIGTIAGIISRKSCFILAIGSDLKIYSQTLIGKSMISWMLKQVSGVICVSRDLEKIAKSFGARNTLVIPPPIDLSGLIERNFRKSGDIISVARLEPVKGIPYLIRAMSLIKDSNLIIIGDGPERSALESLSLRLGLSDRIFILGQLDHNTEFWDRLQEATVFVLPSLSEGLPRVLLEAMTCGLPIVATNVGGIPEIITDGVNGYLVPPRNETALAEAIERVLNDDNFRRNASKENRKMARNYAISIIGQQLYYYLKEVTNNN